MKKPIVLNGETFKPVCPFADGWYYESERHYLLTGPKGDVVVRDVRRRNVPEVKWRP